MNEGRIRKIVHVDIDASEINKNKFAHIPIHSDVKTFLRAITRAFGERTSP